MQTKTIETKFDPKSLPRWTRNHPAVIARCERDYSYRCNVYAANTAQMKKFLIKTAETK